MLNIDQELKKLEEEMENDKSLPFDTNLILGDGNIDCDVLFIGEAPGKKEDEIGIPFVGRSGKLLEESLTEIGIKRSDVYITNIVKRRPPENRDPNRDEIEKYSPYLKKQLEIINPKIIVTLGRFSWKYFNPKGVIGKDQGNFFKFDNYDFIIFPIYHPAAVLYNPQNKSKFKKCFKKLKKFLKDNKY
ncbi:MAG: uracil-DNA glycosylase [Patescibacteria group bacterium]|jgi:uracil-DNA glycosylase family 4|nr:uracil-DNA glycosylase [Patescibacteria group bacterium]